jgi:hypothetical protein
VAYQTKETNDMAHLIEFEDDEIETIADMLREYRASVIRGEVSPSQPREYEIADTEALIRKFERAMHS